MFIKMFTPAPVLRPYLEGILVQEDRGEANFANRNPVTVLPSTMTVIGIQYGRPMHVLQNGKAVTMGSGGITGLHASAKEYVSTGAIGSLILFFKPGGLSRFIRYPIHEFYNADVPLELAFPGRDVRDMAERLAEASDASERVGIAERFLLSVLRDHEEEKLIRTAAHLILRRQGTLSIERLAEELYVSKRTLERRFRASIGASPKQFAGIVRFQQAIRLRNAGRDYLDIVEACGYSDHAHLIHDFNSFAGMSPERFFRSELQPELMRSYQEGDENARPGDRLYC